MSFQDQLEELALQAASGNGKVTVRPLPVRTTTRRLVRVYRRLHEQVAPATSVNRAQEWLLDNRHVIEETLESVDHALPAAYLRHLPTVTAADGPVTQVQALIDIVLAHAGLPLDTARLEEAIAEYQQQVELTIGELWAVPTLVAWAVLLRLLDRAEQLVDDHTLAEPLTDEIAGAIVTLRRLRAQGWRASFESLSQVERLLREDPAQAYESMTFASRNQYRSEIERLARGSRRSESAVCELILSACRQATGDDPRQRHVGYWLLGGGRRRIELEIGFAPTFSERLRKFADRHPGVLFFGLLTGLTGLVGGAIAWLLWWWQTVPSVMAVLLVAAAVPIVGAAVTLLNGLLVWLIPPRRLVLMDYSDGIPTAARTVVVVPVLLTSRADCDQVIERLETNFLGNRDPNLVYAVLGDLADADRAVLDEDSGLIDHMQRQIDRLNQRYDSAHAGGFLFLCRYRQFNAAEDCWMGWERKRGKLMEFNRLLGGQRDTSYDTLIGPVERLSGIRYVITLDADTRMPPGAAQRLVGTMDHPLSRVVVDPATCTLRSGYSILQPRLEVDPDTTAANRFTRVFAGDTTVDLYTHASSDVYHDLFGEGIYAGKGIYDWHALELTLEGRVPDNSLLSHDLLEGVHGRVGLASEIVLMEQFPPTVVSFMRRQHRWIRGDWQLLPWLRRRTRRADGSRERNPLSLSHRWKIIDNLRRSLQPPAFLLLLFLGLTGWVPVGAWLWMLLVLALLAAPLLADLLGMLTRVIAHPLSLPMIARQAPVALGRQALYWLLSLVLLPYKSQVHIDAIVRTLYRMLVSRRGLLQWTAAAHVHRQLGEMRSQGAVWREMWICPFMALAGGMGLLLLNPVGMLVAAPLLLAWFLAPLVAWRIGRVRVERVPGPSAEDRRLLRSIARRTWQFFDRFVGPDDHWMPPDNFQEEPRSMLARRTSPTNIGMALNAGLAAHDFGWVDAQSISVWLRNITDSMERMFRYRGHWLNWYETRDLKPLHPAYVSTVDSGNLAASLLTLARGLERLKSEPIELERLVSGLGDTLEVIANTVAALPARAGVRRDALSLKVRRLSARLDGQPLDEGLAALSAVREQEIPALTEAIIALAEDEDTLVSAEALAELRMWVGELQIQVRRLQRFAALFFPWLSPADQGQGSALPLSVSQCFGNRPTLEQYSQLVARFESLLAGHRPGPPAGDDDHPIEPADDAQARTMLEALERAQDAALAVQSEFDAVIDRIDRWVSEMDFSFLYDPDRELFRIGYDLSAGELDANYYDLLASESRLASLIAIAKGDVPVRHWLYLGRPFRRQHGRMILMSWGATLFEYLMPTLYLRTPANSLLDRSCRVAIELHREFAEAYAIAWGISESGYHQLDEEQVYQYRAFGVPGLGFRRDLGERLVTAPYAGMMALMFTPQAVMANLRRLLADRALGRFGLYEAIDYGRPDKIGRHRPRIVRSWMSHHQGMILLAIDNYLNDQIMQQRFHADPAIASVSMLLHERLPRTSPKLAVSRQGAADTPLKALDSPNLWPVSARATSGQFTLLSNGQLSTLINASGGGGMYWQNNMLTRFSPDDANGSGTWIYIKDLDSGELFSVAADPCNREADDLVVQLGTHMVEMSCRRQDLLCRMTIAISSQHDIEVRRLAIINESGRARRLMVASYAELALTPEAAFRRHPAFARLFIEAERIGGSTTLMFRRRPRDLMEKPLYLAHRMVLPARHQPAFAFETRREAFLGRGRSSRRPLALDDDLNGFSCTEGTVIDPVMATAARIRIEPYGRSMIGFLTGVDRSRRALLAALNACASGGRIDWVFEQARMQTAQELINLRMPAERSRQAMALLSALIVPRPEWRSPNAPDGVQLQEALWTRGISGDLPIIVVQVGADRSMSRIEQVVEAHTLLAGRGFGCDLVFMDTAPSSYEQPTRDRLRDLVDSVRNRTQRNLSGRVHYLPANELTNAQARAVAAAAAVFMDSASENWVSQLAATPAGELPAFPVVASAVEEAGSSVRLESGEELLFDCGHGGFSRDGREYQVLVSADELPPAPWCNVLSNPHFGCLVSDSGLLATWAGNASEHRLTRWSNDAVEDPPSDVLYLRDEETGAVWSMTPAPCRIGSYRVRHGFGYSVFEHASHGLAQQLTVHVDRQQPVRICRIRLSNERSWTRRITLTWHIDWVLGLVREQTAMHLRSELDHDSGTVLVRNVFDRGAGQGRGFARSNLPIQGFTTDRAEFLGCDSDPRWPAGLRRIGLSGRLDAGADDCAVIQNHLDIEPGATAEVIVVLGFAPDRGQALDLAREFSDPARAAASLDACRSHYRQLLGRMRVSTPEPSFDVMINGWLAYQAINARIEGRTGFYQSSGAFGFRDQLQDVMAMLWIDPQVTRHQILTAASRQFIEGDVLHWWHESPLRGVRTRCSDDLLWLPLVTASYVRSTGDASILNETVPYLAGTPLDADEAERYSEFHPSDQRESLFQHCWRAIERAVNVGPHGLPTIGSGDWNDGFNQVSTTGRGESVWLGWFLIRVLHEFAELCELQEDEVTARHCRTLAGELENTLEDQAWDGQWYRRAFYDDGAPLGSAGSDECRIDLIAQAWSVLGPKQPTARSAQAMDAALEHLVDDRDRLILLLDPPFDRGSHHPGYIKGYPPGIRENGAQYTHAATWAVWAMARLGDGNRAMSLFRLLNPVLRVEDPKQAARYRIEPYVLAGDVYSVGANRGRGGWSWYTGAAAWLYRAGIEQLLGLRLLGGKELEIAPCLPDDWPGFRVELAFGAARYDIEVVRSYDRSLDGPQLSLDGSSLEGNRIELGDSDQRHTILVRLPAS